MKKKKFTGRRFRALLIFIIIIFFSGFNFSQGIFITHFLFNVTLVNQLFGGKKNQNKKFSFRIKCDSKINFFNQKRIKFQIFLSLLQRTLAIMVPTGKVGPITPRKMIQEMTVSQPFREPAQVWERIDEGDNPYQPPVYKYTLLDFARKYGRKTLIPPPEDEYYKVSIKKKKTQNVDAKF